MNYLAHTYLSFQKPEILVGNYIADSVHGKNFEGIPEGIVKGITLHRKIDSYTDSHPIYLTSKHRFSKGFDKYSGVLMDIFYDHYLAKNFHLYHTDTLQNYCNGVYKLLLAYHDHLPEHARRFYEYMTKNNILFNYSKLDGIETVLTHLSHRIRHRFELQLAMPILRTQYEEIEDEFLAFLDDLINYCKIQPEIVDL